LKHGNTQWNLSSFSDKVIDKFYQQVIDNEQKNILNAKSDYSSDIKVELVEQRIPKLSYFDPSDTHDKSITGKHTNIVLHTYTTIVNNSNSISLVNKASFYSKVLPDEIDYEYLSPYLAFYPHDVIKNT
jgi:hypothetical protein